MKRTCKQCGREFELTEKEIEFYQDKGLDLPTRCKECRQVKKSTKGSDQGQVQPAQASVNSSEAALLKARGMKQGDVQQVEGEDLGPMPGWTKKKLAITAALMVVVLAVCFGGTFLVRQFM